jgi:hypothetical protein
MSHPLPFLRGRISPALILILVTLAQTGFTQESGRRSDDGRVEQLAPPPLSEAIPTVADGPPSGVSVTSRSGAGAPGANGKCTAPSTSDDLPFRITVDGEPISPARGNSEADRQRCADLALSAADIQVRFDDLNVQARLNVWTSTVAEQPRRIFFNGYANYLAWITRAEVRIFRKGDAAGAVPMAVLPLYWDHPTAFDVPQEYTDGEYSYLLRVYGTEQTFDETTLKRFKMPSARPGPLGGNSQPDRGTQEGWGESSLELRNIAVRGGAVLINGSHLKPDQSVEALGLRAPADASGKFAIEQILPPGPHSVEIRLKDGAGNLAAFRRSLSIPDQDFFYVAVGDLTLGRNSVVGPAALVTQDTQHYNGSTYVDGRGAFYLKGKVKGDWILTASADTGEQPLKNLFSNFSSKDPQYLLRNIDPNAYYPVYGDDSKIVDDAPTQGKFYIRLEKGDSHVLWGNFQTQWNGSELIQYSRGLYGLDLRYRSEESTRFGERKTALDGFAANPGTLGARDEFSSTGGSIYYLRHLDITQGSERLWVEVRDRDSGLVIERKELSPSQDYDIDYIQGRVLLHTALPMASGSAGLVMTGTQSGQPLFLVANYEYVPGLLAVSAVTTGVHATQWIDERYRVGVTSFRQGDPGADQRLNGADFTWRHSAGTFIKGEFARSEGAGSGAGVSSTGGFSFANATSSGQAANARRVDGNVDLGDIQDGAHGSISAYAQVKDRNFSGPGQIAYSGEGVRQEGGRAAIPLGQSEEITVKADVRNADSQDSRDLEAGIKHRLSSEWAATLGVRQDQRETFVANSSQFLSQNGSRTDVMARADYQAPKTEGRGAWSAYGFAQGTAERSDSREANNRAGVGGAWDLHDRGGIKAEASEGNGGFGGLLGANYMLSERSKAYLNYVLETEAPNAIYRGRSGTWVSGSDYRVSEEVRIFGENRVTSGSGPQGLSDALGIELAPDKHWNYGAKLEAGSVNDPLTGDLRRDAFGASAGYKNEAAKLSSNLEYRTESGNAFGHRHVWLARNSLGYKIDSDWRLFSKLNGSISSNSQGAFFDGSYHELVLGGAYRPVLNDRWNLLASYTNFYNLPSPGQVTPFNGVADYSQRSQVLSFDNIFDLTPRFSLGFKYGLRIGEIRDSRTGGDWTAARADLCVLRADWQVVKKWDAVAEARDLRASDARSAQAGALLAVYRRVTDKVKFGAGFNFTNYSDDLTDLSYRSHGWFLNALATL